MMGFFTKLSDLHVQLATLFERLDQLSQQTTDLSKEVSEVARRVARLEGALANSATPEILRQITEINERLRYVEQIQNNHVVASAKENLAEYSKLNLKLPPSRKD